MGLEMIKIFKKQKGFTSKKLSELSGVPIGTLNKILNGQTKNPAYETITALAKALDCSVDIFCDNNTSIDSDKENSNELSAKDNKDIEKKLNETLDMLENQEGLMLSGNPVDSDDWEFIKGAIKNGLEYAKKVNKDKYTPKKYKK